MSGYRYKGISEKNTSSNKANEDRNVWIELSDDVKIMAVFDGATGRGGIPGGVASDEFASELRKMKKSDSLVDVLTSANESLAEIVVKKFDSLLKNIDQLKEKDAELKKALEDYYQATKDHPRMSAQEKIKHIDPAFNTATCGAIVRIDEKNQQLKYVQLGDCMVAVQQEDDSIKVLTDDNVASSDYFSYLAQEKAMNDLKVNHNFHRLRYLRRKKRDLYRQTIAKRIEPDIKDGRRNANNPDSPNGYQIFNGVPIELKSHSVPLEGIKKVAVSSDGLLIPQKKISPDEKEAWEQTFEMLFKKGLKRLKRKVRSIERKDPYMEIYKNRLKKGDDATAAIWVRSRKKNRYPKMIQSIMEKLTPKYRMKTTIKNDREYTTIRSR